jgi:Family of unknown function (DUF5670)
MEKRLDLEQRPQYIRNHGTSINTFTTHGGEKKESFMTLLLIIGILLLVAWLIGLGTRFTLGGMVHIALAVALVLIIIWLLRAVFRII